MIKDSTINTSSKQKVITQIHALTHNKNKHDKTGIHNTYQQDTTLNPIINSSRLTQTHKCFKQYCSAKHDTKFNNQQFETYAK